MKQLLWEWVELVCAYGFLHTLVDKLSGSFESKSGSDSYKLQSGKSIFILLWFSVIFVIISSFLCSLSLFILCYFYEIKKAVILNIFLGFNAPLSHNRK